MHRNTGTGEEGGGLSGKDRTLAQQTMQVALSNPPEDPLHPCQLPAGNCTAASGVFDHFSLYRFILIVKLHQLHTVHFFFFVGQ